MLRTKLPSKQLHFTFNRQKKLLGKVSKRSSIWTSKKLDGK